MVQPFCDGLIRLRQQRQNHPGMTFISTKTSNTRHEAPPRTDFTEQARQHSTRVVREGQVVCAGESDSIRQARLSVVRAHTQSTTFTGRMSRNLKVFQMHSSPAGETNRANRGQGESSGCSRPRGAGWPATSRARPTSAHAAGGACPTRCWSACRGAGSRACGC